MVPAFVKKIDEVSEESLMKLVEQCEYLEWHNQQLMEAIRESVGRRRKKIN